MRYPEGGKQVKVGISQGLPATHLSGAPAAGGANIGQRLQPGPPSAPRRKYCEDTSPHYRRKPFGGVHPVSDMLYSRD
jgi:hypothetical protein